MSDEEADDDRVGATTPTPEASGTRMSHKVVFQNSSITSLEASVCASHPNPPVTIFELTLFQRILAGSGHVLNDLCASLWFTYLLVYLQKVVNFSDTHAAGLLLWGQLSDGLATPFVGYAVDHVQSLWPLKKSYGRCKSWHLLGTVSVMLSFPFIFSPCVGYSYHTSEWAQVPPLKKAVYYAPFIAIFQIGWGCAQISHLALIPKLTPDDLVRTEILAIRYAFTVGANVSVFLMTWFFLWYFGTQHEHNKCQVDADDAFSFSAVTLLSVGLGGLFSILFHVFVVEQPDQIVKRSATLLKMQGSVLDTMKQPNAIPNSGLNSNPNSEGDIPAAIEDQQRRRNRTSTHRELEGSEEASLLGRDNEDDDNITGATSKTVRIVSRQVSRAYSLQPAKTYSIIEKLKSYSTKSLNIGKENMGVADWLRLPQFYLVAGVYLSTRLAVNLSQAYMPFYLEISLGLDCSFVAVIPLTMYCSGFGISLVIKMMNKYLGRQMAYGIGTAFITIGAILILTLDWSSPVLGWAIYLIAILIGGGASVILVTSFALTADLIGNNVESGAFVYGAVSFCDKCFCGFAVVLINSLIPCGSERTDCASEQTHTNVNAKFYADALGYSSGGSSLAGLTFIVLLTSLIVRNSKRLKLPTPTTSATPVVEAES